MAWSLGVVSGFENGSSGELNVGDFGESCSGVFGDSCGSSFAPCRSRVGVPVGVSGDGGDCNSSSVLTSMFVFVGSPDVSIGVGFW